MAGHMLWRLLLNNAAAAAPPPCRAQKKAEREAMLRSQFEEKRAERVQKYQVGPDLHTAGWSALEVTLCDGKGSWDAACGDVRLAAGLLGLSAVAKLQG